MKTIRIVNAIDIAGQLSLTIWFLILPSTMPEVFGRQGSYAQITDGLFDWLYAFGAWQVVSWLVHWAFPLKWIDAGLRKAYGIALLFAPLLMWTVILYPVPMAIFYLTICCIELFRESPELQLSE